MIQCDLHDGKASQIFHISKPEDQPTKDTQKYLNPVNEKKNFVFGFSGTIYSANIFS